MNTTQNGKQELSHRYPKSILFKNQTADVVLLDIPASIAEAQEWSEHEARCLLSCPVLEKPFPSHEPKNAKARANLERQAGRSTDFLYQPFVEHGLCTIGGEHQGDWCLPRAVRKHEDSVSRKRKLEHDNVEVRRELISSREDVTQLLGDVVSGESLKQLSKVRWCDDCPENAGSDIHFDDDGLFVANTSPKERRLEFELITGQKHTFFIPPLSSSLVSDCSRSAAFYSKVKSTAEQHGTKRSFDLIMMDPPWPNKAIRRGHEKGRAHYSVSDTLWDLRQLIFDMDIDVLLADKGYIGVWITNNAAVRDLVVGDDGFFESWGVKLVEEWIWIKVTKSGEPVMPLASCWRKPYEVLLLGRKVDQPSLAEVPLYSQDASDVKRRLIAAVPDLHSRKPCLKSLLEPLMTRPDDYRALEIFARNLVSGWWSWGNEAIKFNHDSCWIAPAGVEAYDNDRQAA
ncbi:hypothetical protein MBLNU457_1187t1 [Dothideomycetes sp. NU457]